jgi:uncharacterized membrane protein (UPF0127 family)
MILRNSTTNAIIATRVNRLTGFFERAVGLLARASIAHDEGVWLSSCAAIHTLGMRQAIDVMFVDGEGIVLRVCRDVRPNRPILICGKARAVVEIGGGALEPPDVTIGDQLELIAGESPLHLRSDGFQKVGTSDDLRR